MQQEGFGMVGMNVVRGLGFAALGAVAGMSGCASTPSADTQATHYWESSKDATQNRYRVDNLACQSSAQANAGSAIFEPGSESFDAYRDCMINRGYVLRQY